MQVGDLVLRNNNLVSASLGLGVIIETEADADGELYQVKWSRGTRDLYWYDKLDLEVVSEGRRSGFQ